MDERQDSPIDAYESNLGSLIRRGQELRDSLAAEYPAESALAATRVWQRDCAAMINQLSGGSKAHWLARAYSEAFLMRSPGRVVQEAQVSEIVDRILGVLDQAAASLSQMSGAVLASAEAAPRIRRFEFVHNAKLRPILEQAYVDSRSALEQGRFGAALVTSCGILEAVITDALENLEHVDDAPGGTLADWPFEARIAVAEKAGLIRGGCARLPPAARSYRDLTDGEGVLRPDVIISEREARLASQVLHVVLRDLDPGR